MDKKKQDLFLDLATRLSREGTCLRRNYGAMVISPRLEVISTGYTGSPRRVEHCVTCQRVDKGIPSGCNYELCRSVHAEANALLQAGRQASGCTLVLAGTEFIQGNLVTINAVPCLMCWRLIINAGIETVISTPHDERVEPNIWNQKQAYSMLESIEKEKFQLFS